MDLQKMIDWYKQNVGKHTYSMDSNSRFDCSSSVASALAYASGKKINVMSYNTVNLGALLKSLGFVRVYAGSTLGANVKEFDVILMTNGANMSQSAGASGHTGVIGSGGTFWNTTPTNFYTGQTYAKGQAVQSSPWNSYKVVTRLKNYTEVWRYGAKQTSHAKLELDGFLGLGTWREIGRAVGVDSGSVISGQTLNNKSRLKGVTVKVSYTGEGSLTVSKWQKKLGVNSDGIIGKEFITALQKRLKKLGYYSGAIDGVFDYPSTTILAWQKWLNKGI